VLDRLASLGLRRSAWIAALVGALVYANSLGNGFAFDDTHAIVNNTAIHSPATLAGALVAPYWPAEAGTQLAIWRPVTTGLFGIEYLLGGGSPLVFHLTNVLVHALVSALVVVLLGSLLPLPAAFLAGLLFAVHPVHSEAVANGVGIAELFSTAAVLGACILHLRSGERSGWVASLGVGGLFVLAFGAKESAVTLPGLVFLLDAARERLGWRDLRDYLARRWRVYAVMAVVAASLLMARLEVLAGSFVPLAPGGAHLLSEIPRIWTLGEIWTHYVRLWVFPQDLASDYTPNVVRVWTAWHLTNTLGVVLVLGILGGALVAWRRAPLGPGSASARAAAFGVVWFGIAVSPVSNTLFLSGILLAERTLYLPTVGLAAASAWLVLRVARHRPAMATGAVAAFVVLGAARTWQRNPTWKDDEAVFFTLMAEHPQSGRSQWLLGDSFIQLGRQSDALRAYRAAAGLLDSHYGLLTHVATKLMDMGRYESADRLLDVAIGDHPEEPLAYRMRAGLRAELGDAAGAERYARAARRLVEADPLREVILAWALASQGSLDEALEWRTKAEAQIRARFWQGFVTDAYFAERQGDTLGVRVALDSAYAAVGTDIGRRALDSLRVNRFGLAAPEPGR